MKRPSLQSLRTAKKKNLNLVGTGREEGGRRGREGGGGRRRGGEGKGGHTHAAI